MKKRWTLLLSLLLLPCLAGGEEAFLLPSKQIYDRYGTPVRGFLSKNNTYYLPVSLNEVSPWLIAAAVAAEDKRFFTHAGVDIRAVCVPRGKTPKRAKLFPERPPLPNNWRARWSRIPKPCGAKRAKHLVL